MNNELNITSLPVAIAEIHRLREENIKQADEIVRQADELVKQAHELLYYKRLFFGRRSEKRMPDSPEGQLFIPFGSATIEEETPDIKPLVEEIQIESHKRRIEKKKTVVQPKRQEIPADIERQTRVIEPAGINPEEMIKIGENVREILQYIPGRFYVDRIVRPIYKERVEAKEAISTQLFQAPAVESFIPKSYAGNTLLTQLIISKYVDHLPVYRQLEIFKRHGIKLPASTIAGWMQEVSTQLYPLYAKLAEQVLASDYLQIDESTLPVIDDEKKRAVKGYIWVVLARIKDCKADDLEKLLPINWIPIKK